MSEQLNMKKRLAICRNTEHDFITVIANHTDDDEWMLGSYVRLSEWQVVEFKALPPEATVAAQVQALTVARAKVVAEFTERLGEIDARMANLRALTGPTS